MATLIPALGACVSRMTAGERRLAERLEQKLDDDYLPTLVEHLHIYVDSFIGSILYVVAKFQATTIPSVLELFSVHEKIRTDELSAFAQEKTLSPGSTLDWVFGRENILRDSSGM